MSDAPPKRLLLGPQRPVRNLGEAIAAADVPDGPLAVISAGWQEAEADTADVAELAGRSLVDLRLYQRAEQLFAADRDLYAAYRERQDRLVGLQRLYRRRLKHLSAAARDMLRIEDGSEMVAAEQRHAVAQLRALDRHHLNRVEALYDEFRDAHPPETHPSITEHRAAIDEAIGGCSAVLITGGNVVVMMNRMRLFGLKSLLEGRHVIAWSAGAMVLAERIVLFHDRTPQGRREPELLAAGACIVPGYVILPDASRRLRLKDKPRVGLYSRRFAPDTCVVLDSGCSMSLRGVDLAGVNGARRIDHDGRIERIRAA